MGRINIVYLGRVSVEKSIDILIKAFRIILIDFPDAKLYIVGTGPHANELKEMCRHYCLYKNVVFTGNIEHDELIKSGFMSAFDIFATASKSENQPVSIMEAMAYGLPIVGVNKLGVPELIHNKVNGFVTEPDDYIELAKSILTILKDPALKKRFCSNSLKIIKKHDLKIVSKEIENVYMYSIKNMPKKLFIDKI